MGKRSSNQIRTVLVIFLEEKHRERVQSQFSETLETGDAHALYRAFLEDTISACLDYDSSHVVVSYSQGKGKKIVIEAMEELQNSLRGKSRQRLEQNEVELWEQTETALSGNLERTFDKCFRLGFNQVLLIDCVTPTITQQIFEHARRSLAKKDIVFGPTLEGSYYLLGMRRMIPAVFRQIDWDVSDHIYSRIVEVARDNGLDWDELELWYDLRQAGDLEYLVRDINAFRIIGDEVSAKRTETVLETLIQKFQGEES